MSNWYETEAFYHIYPLGLCGAPFYNPVLADMYGYQAIEGSNMGTPYPKDMEDIDENGRPIVHRMRRLFPWVEHIADMGFGAIYIGPLFESTAHGYDTIDYKLVDRRLGDNADFKEFVRLAHEKNIKVVVDGVFNHTGREFIAFQDTKKNREASPYRWWYKGVNFGGNSAYNDGFSYESWRGCVDLVNLDLKNWDVRGYLFDVIRYWITEFDIDGIRLDCADCLDFDFMKEMRHITCSMKTDFYLLGEVIHGDYSRWANNDTLHAVTNYELSKGLWSGHNDHNYFEIAHTIRRQYSEGGGIYQGRTLYTFVDNHDVARLVNKLNNPAHTKLVYLLNYTLPGVPSVYYGSEWGIQGRKQDGDPALRPAIDLEQISQNPPVPGLCEFLTDLGRLRRENEALRTGRYQELLLTTRQYAFSRTQGDQTIIMALNNDDAPADMWIPKHAAGSHFKGLLSGVDYQADGDKIHVTLPAGGYEILKCM